MAGHARDTRRIEEVGAALQTPLEAVGGLRQREGHVELRRAAVDVDRRHPEAGEGEGADRCVLQDEERLKEWRISEESRLVRRVSTSWSNGTS